jgi:ABC-type multidrug transport system ATPase subunit
VRVVVEGAAPAGRARPRDAYDSAALFHNEPTAGLDPVATREVHELIASLRDRGVTVFLSTQRLDEAERLCDRVAILNTTMRLIGRPDELRARLFRRSWKFGSARRSLIQRRSSVTRPKSKGAVAGRQLPARGVGP